jgi:hypothetical protein
LPTPAQKLFASTAPFINASRASTRRSFSDEMTCQLHRQARGRISGVRRENGPTDFIHFAPTAKKRGKAVGLGPAEKEPPVVAFFCKRLFVCLRLLSSEAKRGARIFLARWQKKKENDGLGSRAKPSFNGDPAPFLPPSSSFTKKILM